MPTHSPDYVEAMLGPNQARPKLTHNPQLGPAELDRLAMFDETWRDLEMRGFPVASVVRFVPWTLSPDGAAHNCKRYVGVPIEPDSWATFVPRIKLKNGLSVPFTHDVITAPYITVGTRFRGRGESDSAAEVKASVDLPLVLARDLAYQQNLYKSQGGIFCYEGSELPQNGSGQWLGDGPNKPRKAWMTKDEMADSIEAAAHQAFDRMLTHMKSIMDQATSAHLSQAKEELREIRGNRFRQSVQYLLNVGVIAEPPTWFMQRFDASASKLSQCPMCPKKVEAGTKKCSCGYILDPFGAYGHLYTEESDGGLLTARRMTKEQLKTLGLYPRIKPLEEHLSDKAKEAKDGK